MADNVAITAGAGTSIATDDVAGVQFQKVKLDGGGDGLSAPITGDTAQGLDVDVTRVQGTVTVSDTATKVDDAAYAPGTDRLMVIGGQADEAASDPVDEGDAGALRMTLSRALHANLRNASGTELATAGAPLRVDPTGTTTQPVQDNASLVDDAVFTPGSGRVVMMGAEADETTPDLVDEGDGGALRMTLARSLHTTLRDSTGDSAMDDANNAVRVNIVAGAAAGGTSMTDDSTFTPASSAITPVGGTYRSTRDLVDDNDAGAIAITQRRALLTAVETPNGDSAMDDTLDAIRVNVVGGGGGTQYTEGDVDATITGDAVMYEGAANTLFVAGLTTPFPVQLRDSVGDSAMDDANNALRVNIVAGGGSGGTASADDSAFAIGSGNGTPIMGLFDNTTPDSVDENDVGVVRMSANRNLFSQIRDAAGNERGANVTAAGALNVDASGVTLTAGGVAAHDAAASGNPVLLAGIAQDMDDTAPPNGVSAENDVVRLATDRDGALFVHTHGPRSWHTAAEYTAQQTDATVKGAPGVGLSLYITDIYCAVNGAVTVTIEESTSTLKWRYYGGGQGDGVSINFTTPLKIAANTLISVTTSAAVTVFLDVHGFTAAG